MRRSANLEVFTRNLWNFAMRLPGCSAAAETHVDIAQRDVFQERIADGVEYDALPGLAGTVILPERDIRKLLAFGNDARADPIKADISQKTFLRRIGCAGALARAIAEIN